VEARRGCEAGTIRAPLGLYLAESETLCADLVAAGMIERVCNDAID